MSHILKEPCERRAIFFPFHSLLFFSLATESLRVNYFHINVLCLLAAICLALRKGPVWALRFWKILLPQSNAARLHFVKWPQNVL